MLKLLQIGLLFVVLASCSREIKTEEFPFFLSDKAMIINLEQDNKIEGRYIVVEKFHLKDSSFSVKLPQSFFVNETNFHDWIIGWGDEKPYYDAGVENVRSIRKIDVENGKIHFGKLFRGKGFPKDGQRIVFWNTKPSGFKRITEKSVIDLSKWPAFHGESVSFGAIQLDTSLNKWVMLFNECDTNQISIYAALSDNLVDWVPANHGDPILEANDFLKTTWAGYDKTGKIEQSPQISDVCFHNGKWHLFLDGYGPNGKRQIGLAVSENSLLGPFEIQKQPIILVGEQGSWDESSVFYAKVNHDKNKFYLFYDGVNELGIERVGMATSVDFINWEKASSNPVISEHEGWRSAAMCSEPNFVHVQGDTILLMVAGIKNFRTQWWNRFMPGGMFVGLSGNVYDAQLGCYISLDGGKSFVEHPNNPLMVNDYSDRFENEHMGGNIEWIETDTMDYLIYQAKSSFQGLKYNILVRARPK